MVSHLAEFILWLHARAEQEKRIPFMTPEALAVLCGLRHQPVIAETDEYRVGLELRDGRPHSELARRLQRRAMAETDDPMLVLANVDEAGYTVINIRALLSQHYWSLQDAPLGTDANCAYIDLTTAINRASDRTRLVAWLLIAGLGPQEIGKLLATNGSRKINRALAELARILEGRFYEKTTATRAEAGSRAD